VQEEVLAVQDGKLMTEQYDFLSHELKITDDDDDDD
jgi:major membrane immunogen (membrane-anchored lipoprotein)